MTRSELIETMARALYVRINGSPYGFGTFPGTSLETQCTGHATAALEAHDRLAAPARTYADGLRDAAKVARKHMDIFYKIGEPGHFEIAEEIEDEILSLAEKDGQ